MPNPMPVPTRTSTRRSAATLLTAMAVLAAPAQAQRGTLAEPPNLRGIDPAQLRAINLAPVTRASILNSLRKFPGGAQALAQIHTTDASGTGSDAASSVISYDPTKAQASASAPWINSWLTYESVNFGYYGYPLITLRGGQNSDVILMLNPVNAAAPIWVVITLDLAGGLNSGFTFQRTGDGQLLASCTRAQVQASGGSSPYGSCMVVIQVPPSGLGIKITPDNFISLLRTTVAKM